MLLFFVGGLCAIALMFVRIAVGRQFEILVDGSLIWLAISLVVAGGLISWGQLKLGHPVISLNLASMVTAIASVTGGLESFMLAWLLVVPFGAVFSASWMQVVLASVLALGGVGGLYLAQLWSVLPVASPQDSSLVLHIAGMVTAMIYSGAHGAAGFFMLSRTDRFLAGQGDIYRLVAENSSDVFSLHDRAGDTQLVSASASGLFEVGPNSLLGPAFVLAIHELDREAFVLACARAIDQELESELELRLRRRPFRLGKYLWVRCRFRPHEEKSRSVLSCVVVTRDFSDHKKQEILLRDSREAASQADRAKTRLLANVTHELRTPLNAIIGFSDLLGGELRNGTKGSNPDSLNDYVDLINESGIHLLQVVNDLLEMSKLEAGESALMMEAFDLGDLLTKTAMMIEPFAKTSGVRLEFDFSRSIGPVVADKRAIRQIVFNLLSNAVKFSNHGSVVTMGAGVGDYAATIWVQDEGIGITKRDQKRLGQPFFQADGNADRNFEGTGLGLSVVKKLVENHDGSTLIQSEPGRGTTVWIKFPRRVGSEPGEDQPDRTGAFSAPA